MKKTVPVPVCLFFFVQLLSITCYAQPTVSWGKPFEMRRSSSDLSVVHVDASGIFLEEADRSAGGGPMTPGRGNPFLLMKMNASMQQVYLKDYEKALKGKSMAGFFFVRDKLYIFASNFDRTDKNAYLYAAELDKGTGDLKGGWQEVYRWVALGKGSDVLFRIGLTHDTTGILITSTYTYPDLTSGSNEVKVMDASLQTVDSSFTIANEFDPKFYHLEDIFCANPERFILVARIFDYAEGKKKKDKNLEFRNYNIRVYDNHGKMLKEIRTDIDGNYLVSGSLALSKKELLLAAFYSNDKAKSVINGMLVQRMDAVTGEIISTNKKELNSGLIADVEADDAGARPAADTANGEGLAPNLIFRHFFFTHDGGMVILAEQFSKETISGYGVASRPYDEFTCGNLYMSKISAGGDIEWLNVLPKKQVEDMTLRGGGFGIGINGFSLSLSSWWEDANARPYYGSFACLAVNDKINIFFNDNEKNAAVLQEGTKIKKVNNKFSKTDCFLLTLDVNTGKLTRNIFFKNADIPPPMLRLSAVRDHILYVVGRTDNVLGPASVAVGKITMTP